MIPCLCDRNKHNVYNISSRLNLLCVLHIIICIILSYIINITQRNFIGILSVYQITYIQTIRNITLHTYKYYIINSYIL